LKHPYQKSVATHHADGEHRPDQDRKDNECEQFFAPAFAWRSVVFTTSVRHHSPPTARSLIKRYRRPIKDPAGMFRKRATAQYFERPCAPHSIDTLGAVGQRAISDGAECRGGLRREVRDKFGKYRHQSLRN